MVRESASVTRSRTAARGSLYLRDLVSAGVGFDQARRILAYRPSTDRGLIILTDTPCPARTPFKSNFKAYIYES
jgi:hypothetical protein